MANKIDEISMTLGVIKANTEHISRTVESIDKKVDKNTDNINKLNLRVHELGFVQKQLVSFTHMDKKTKFLVGTGSVGGTVSILFVLFPEILKLLLKFLGGI